MTPHFHLAANGQNFMRFRDCVLSRLFLIWQKVWGNYRSLTRPNFQLPGHQIDTVRHQRPIKTQAEKSDEGAGAGNLGGCKMFLNSLVLAKEI